MDKRNAKPALQLEVQELERRAKPGCTSSSTSRLCTCPVLLAGDDFQAS